MQFRKNHHVCFVALSSYNVVANDKTLTHIGGAEVQQLVMANWLRQQGYRVSFVTFDHGQGDGTTGQGFDVFTAFDENSGLRGLRFFHPRWTGLCSALERADADIYYQRGAGVETGQVAMWCKLHRRPFIYGTANDRDLLPSLPFLPNQREKVIYRIGLKLADAVVCQSETQRGMLERNFNVGSLVIPNSGSKVSASKAPAGGERWILWVGRFINIKRLEFLLDVADKCPEYEFHVVGDGNKDSEYVQGLLQRAAGMKNVCIHGHVPYDQMQSYYDRSMIVCNTSIDEGFPNVYVEAWGSGIPVLATFDPDGAIVKSGAGWFRQEPSGFISVLRDLQDNPDMWERASQSARDRYDTHHCAGVNLPTFENLIHSHVVN